MSQSTMTVGEFATLVHAYCLAFSASETSGTRSVERNKAVGGVVKSAHLTGHARDVVYDGSTPGEEADAWLGENGLKRISEGDHDHLMPADWRA